MPAPSAWNLPVPLAERAAGCIARNNLSRAECGRTLLARKSCLPNPPIRSPVFIVEQTPCSHPTRPRTLPASTPFGLERPRPGRMRLVRSFLNKRSPAWEHAGRSPRPFALFISEREGPGSDVSLVQF